MQLGDPTLSDHISSEYARLDFDGVDEFTLFFSSEHMQSCIYYLNVHVHVCAHCASYNNNITDPSIWSKIVIVLAKVVDCRSEFLFTYGKGLSGA